ncbi:AAA family ATPase [Sulfurimonas hydrogeniphila]|uniref:AAA family ATPase n=1 Tax=Sulfurimonas hydrogeniphila TaxID=2509341 RepID=UPI001E53D219|nr:ATP-binding protein [Sulfurimonas hydrogeniphila]
MKTIRKREQRRYTLEINKEDYIDKNLIDKASLWTLRILLKLGGHKEFIDKDDYILKDNIFAFLGGNKFLENEKFTREDILEYFAQKLEKLEQQKRFSSHPILSTNIAQISSLMNLNRYEEQILEFSVLIKQYEILDDAVELLGHELNTTQVKRALSIILNIPKDEVKKALSSKAKLTKSSLVLIDKRNTNSLDRKLDSISDTFIDNLLNLDEDISVMLKESVSRCSKGSLKLKDYEHIKEDINLLLPYLKKSIKQKQEGVNILLYGAPGTGKTELAKTLAKKLKLNLFEVSYTDEDDESIDGEKRLKSYRLAQALLGDKKTLLMYDEAEDIFQGGGSSFFSMLFGSSSRQKDKAWINKVLETNTIPTIWITNNINALDPALVRRFDMSIELPIPPKSKREKIIESYSNGHLDTASIQTLAEHEDVAPALITRASKVLEVIGEEKNSDAFIHLVSNTLKAQGHKELEKGSGIEIAKNIYNPSYINTSTDLEKLTLGIKESKNARLCLYGAPGTGKSAYGKYIAKQLNKPCIIKKGSDLISKWVGGTEQNIANAFKEAEAEDAVLVFDEVDSFLSDRTQAQNSWEVTQVNEMLVQMENFNGIFIATTNLMDNLDKASLRRFDLKLEFEYLKAEQSLKLFSEYVKEFGFKKLADMQKQKVKSLRNLAPGDFAAVARQNRFNPLKSVEDFIQRLEDEVAVKNEVHKNVMGFLA